MRHEPVQRRDAADPLRNRRLRRNGRALRLRPRSIAPKYFYDAAGSALFDRICELPEYYPTRTEIALLRQHAPAMAAQMGDADAACMSSLLLSLIFSQRVEVTAERHLEFQCTRPRSGAGRLPGGRRTAFRHQSLHHIVCGRRRPALTMTTPPCCGSLLQRRR